MAVLFCWAERGREDMKNRRGFTIVELMIVIIVIAILASITIVAYTGVQERARNVATQATLRDNFINQIEIFRMDNGRYPISEEELESLDIALSHTALESSVNTTLYCYQPDGQRAGLVGRAANGRNTGDMHAYRGSGGFHLLLDTGSSPVNRCRLAMDDNISQAITGINHGGAWRAWTGNLGVTN